jgi:hypothetical protein
VCVAVSFSLSPLPHAVGDHSVHSLCTGRVCSMMNPTPTTADGPTIVHRKYVVITACSGVMIRKPKNCGTMSNRQTSLDIKFTIRPVAE